MMKILMIISFINTILFYSMKTPLSMGLILLIQTLNITLISGKMSLNFWFSYILFLIMLGGMLILFIYVSSLSSNQKFILNKNYMIMNLMLLLIFILMIFSTKLNLSMNLEMKKLMDLEIDQNFMLKMSLNKLYNNPTNQIMIMLMNYLLLTLFIVVKITNINMGSLRKSF
uniref:NADH-ubiquinone oxidoreductase chain 6 n=1 Tax=Taxoblenus sp. TaxID=2821556 RepID=A0A8A6C457_9HYME|nr:NADH dehydrogenase subunit 6 [Taxoblenus sinicus]